MNQARDTFLHFIADNLPTTIPCHALRTDPNVRSAGALAMNTVNVAFLNVSAGNDTAWCVQQAVIDVINDDENTAADWVGVVFGMLRAAFYTPMFDYSDPLNPVPTGTNVSWDKRRITFKKVACDAYTHYSCLLSLKFVLP